MSKKEKYPLARLFEKSLMDQLPVGYQLLRNPDVAQELHFTASSDFHGTKYRSIKPPYKPLSKIYIPEQD